MKYYFEMYVFTTIQWKSWAGSQLTLINVFVNIVFLYINYKVIEIVILGDVFIFSVFIFFNKVYKI